MKSPARVRGSGSADGAAGGPRRRRVTPPGTVLLIASGGVFTAFLDATIVNTVFPEIARTFQGASISELSWVFNAYSIIIAAFLIPAGRMADLLGRRRGFLIGTVVFTVGSMLCAAAPSLELLVGARALQAVGGALLIPTSLALVLDAYPGTSRARGLALWTAVGAIAAGLGPAVGGLLVEVSGWRLAFLVNLPVGVLIYVATKRRIVESRAPGGRVVPDLLGGAILATSIAALVLAITNVNDWGAASIAFAASVLVWVATTIVFIARTRTHHAPLFELDLFRVPAFSTASLLTVLASAGYFSYLLCNILFLTSVWGYSVLQAGLALTPGPFIAAAVARRSAVLTTRYGFAASVCGGAGVWVVGIAWMITRVGQEPAFLEQWLPGMLILGVGAGVTIPNMSGVALAAAPDVSFGTATALNSVMRQVGAALGIALLVAIVGTPEPARLAEAFDQGWALAAVLFTVVALGGVTLRRVRQQEDAPVEPQRLPPLGSVPLRVTAGAGAVGRLSAFFAEAAAAKTETVHDVLSRADWFGGLPARAVAELAELAIQGTVIAGAPVYAAGEPAGRIHILRSGRVQLTGEHGEPVEIGRNGVLGAVAALSRTPHAETAVALRDTELISLDREDVFRISREVPVAGPKLLTMVSRRLGDAPAVPSRATSPGTIALVALDPEVGIRDVAAQLSDAFGRLGAAALLDGRERQVTPPESVFDVFGPLLARTERDVERTLLVTAGDLADPWTRFCLQHADRVVAVATPRTPAPAGAEQLRGSDLVLLGEGPAQAELATAIAPRRTQHVTDPGDVDRLARRLAGRSLGVVLSGGGARAFAHIGVLAELVAAGVQIDRVGGCSMGAYIGALLARGVPPEEIDAYCYDHWVRSNPVGDYTVPRYGFIRGDLMKRMLQDTFGDQRMEDLPLNFFCVSVDLRAQELVVHREGPLWVGVGAGLNLPIIGPPHIDGRRLLIDGSLMNNLPVDVMAADGEGPVIAIDIKAGAAPAGNGEASVVTRPPTIMNTLGRVLLLASANTSTQAALYADRLIDVRVGGVGLLEFHQIDAAIEIGSAAGRAALEADGPSLGLA